MSKDNHVYMNFDMTMCTGGKFHCALILLE